MAETIEEAREAAIRNLDEAMRGFVIALRDCYLAGMLPSDALRATGLDVPVYAQGMIDAPLIGILERA